MQDKCVICQRSLTGDLVWPSTIEGYRDVHQACLERLEDDGWTKAQVDELLRQRRVGQERQH